MFYCGRWIFVALAVSLADGKAVKVARADDTFAGFIAVQQIWSSGDLMQIAPDRHFLAVGAGSEVDVVALGSGTILRRLETGPQTITGLGISADSKTIGVIVQDGARLAWNVETGRPTAPLDLTFKRTLQDRGGAYTFKLASDPDSASARIEVSSGTHAIASLNVDAKEAYCGPDLVSPIFDGKYLVYGLSDHAHFEMIAAAAELRDGAFHELWHSPCDDKSGRPEVLGDGHFLSLADYEAGGPLTVWNLRANRIGAAFKDTDNLVAVSKDGGTIVAAAYVSQNSKVTVFKVVENSRARSFPRQMKDIRFLVLSPNGRWLAAQDEKSVLVWSTSDGKLRRTIKSGSSADKGRLRAIGDDGALTLMSDHHATFHGEDSFEESTDGRWAFVNGDIFDLKNDRRVAHLPGAQVDHFDGNRAVIRDGLWRLLNLTTARTMWTLHLPSEGYVLTFPDGCVQVAPGAERFVKLVRGFEVRPFDAAAAKVFAKPGCKGRPEAIAASDAAFAADQLKLAALEREDEDARIAAKKAEADEAAQRVALAESQRRQRQAREEIDRLWDHPETRVAGGPQRAALSDEWPIAIAPGRVKVYRGTIVWALAKNGATNVAVGNIAINDGGSLARIKIYLAKDAGGVGHGVIDIVFAPDDPSSGWHVASVQIPSSREESARSSEPLDGSVTGVARNAFRIDLHDRAAIEQLLAAYWIDVPLVESGLNGKLTFEKGTEGQRMIAEALGGASPR